MTDRERHWAGLMRAANRGDAGSYHRLLHELAPVLRGVVGRGFARAGLGTEDVEDVVQETLLALHLKRHTWDERRRLLPWVVPSPTTSWWTICAAVAGGAFADRGPQRDARGADPQAAAMHGVDAEHVIASLEGRQRDIVLAISIEAQALGRGPTP